MPTREEREYYRAGYQDGLKDAQRDIGRDFGLGPHPKLKRSSPKRKLSAWNKYVKANSKKPRFRYRNGKLNLKKMAIAFRKTPAGRKKRR
jgi:hypothetical protein